MKNFRFLIVITLILLTHFASSQTVMLQLDTPNMQEKYAGEMLEKALLKQKYTLIEEFYASHYLDLY